MVDSNRFKQNHTPYTGFPPIGYNVLHVRVCKSYCQLYVHPPKIQVVYLPISPDNGQSTWVFLVAQLCTEIAGWVVLIRQTPPNCSGPAWWRNGLWNPWIGCLNHPWLFVGWSLYVGWIYYDLVVMISSIYRISVDCGISHILCKIPTAKLKGIAFVEHVLPWFSFSAKIPCFWHLEKWAACSTWRGQNEMQREKNAALYHNNVLAVLWWLIAISLLVMQCALPPLTQIAQPPIDSTVHKPQVFWVTSWLQDERFLPKNVVICSGNCL